GRCRPARSCCRSSCEGREGGSWGRPGGRPGHWSGSWYPVKRRAYRIASIGRGRNSPPRLRGGEDRALLRANVGRSGGRFTRGWQNPSGTIRPAARQMHNNSGRNVMRNRLALAVLSAALLSATASLAQAPTSQAPTSQAPTSQAQPPAGAPAPVPEAMPNDIPYGTPVGVEMAEKAITAATAEARKHNWKMSISVVDPSGNLIAPHTMDGTQYASIALSQAKARTAALYRR